jgi:hypothetical protein
MKVLAVEKFGVALLDPLGTGQRLTFGAMTIAAGSVANAPVAAGVTLFDLTAEGRRPAHFDGGHDASLRRGHRRTVSVTIRCAVAAEDIRHFQLRTMHERDAQTL